MANVTPLSRLAELTGCGNKKQGQETAALFLRALSVESTSHLCSHPPASCSQLLIPSEVLDSVFPKPGISRVPDK